MIAPITPENEDFVQRQLAAGAFPDREAVINAGLALLRQRIELIERLQEGRRQLDDGEFVDYDATSIRQLFTDLKRRAGAGATGHEAPAST
jgi:Arc/MetJ-type ribon-helix-helix transcriptional regulator